MNHNVKDWDKPEADIAKVHRQSLEAGILLREHVGGKLFGELLVDLKVLLVPVLQQVMFRRHVPAKFVHSVSEISRFEKQQLDDEETDLGLVALMVAERHAEHESVQGDDVVLPDHAVHRLDALVHMPASSGFAELVHEEVAESAKMSRQLFGSNLLQHFVSNGRDIIRLQDHFPQKAEEEGVAALREMSDDIVLIVHRAPRFPLLIHGPLQLGHVLLGRRTLRDHLREDGGKVCQGVGRPRMRGAVHYRGDHLLQPPGPVLLKSPDVNGPCQREDHDPVQLLAVTVKSRRLQGSGLRLILRRRDLGRAETSDQT